jgi:hypothetical protein
LTPAQDSLTGPPSQADRYDNPMPELTLLAPQSDTKNLATAYNVGTGLGGGGCVGVAENLWIYGREYRCIL